MSESTHAQIEGKPCSKCAEFKPLDAFGTRGEGRPRRADCKSCVAAASRERYRNSPELRAKHKALRDRWREENPTYHVEYYRQNRERIIAAAVAYGERNPPDRERRREWERAWYAANRDRHVAQDRAWRAANPEAAREKGRRGQSRRRAHLRRLPHEPYTMAELFERDGTLCVLCGEELDLTVVYPAPHAPSIEHLECISWPDSAGDVPTNVALSHWRCNDHRKTRPHPAAAQKRAELLAAEAAAS